MRAGKGGGTTLNLQPCGDYVCLFSLSLSPSRLWGRGKRPWFPLNVGFLSRARSFSLSLSFLFLNMMEDYKHGALKKKKELQNYVHIVTPPEKAARGKEGKGGKKKGGVCKFGL